jgi:thiol:disulfide interchange protein DsbA
VATPAAAGDGEALRIAQAAPAAPSATPVPSGRWQAGKHYRVLSPAQPTDSAPGRVEVNEVFWYGCNHCYALDPFLENWKKKKAPHVDFVRTPVMWGPVHKQHARLYYVVQALNRPELHTKVFDAIHLSGAPLVGQDEASSRRIQLEFMKTLGVSEADFNAAYDGFALNTNMQRAEQATRRYRIEGVPLIIIGGKYVTDVAMAGGQEQLIALINDLAANPKG